MKLLTIVIPSYNTENFIDKNMPYYLDECLYEYVEILLIDDGSKDATKDKANEYQNRYPDYIKVISKENGGHGSVINCGIREADGKYFKVIDADDWVETENLIRFVAFLKSKDTDLIVNPYYKIDAVTGRKWKIDRAKKIEYGRNYQFDEVINSRISILCLHNITIRTDILRENKITLTEKCFYDDFQYVIFPIPFVESVTFFEDPVYCYLVGQKNQSVSNSSVLKNRDMHLKIYADSIDYFKMCDIPLSVAKEMLIHKSIIGFGKSIYNIFLRNHRNSECYSMIKEYDAKVHNISHEYYNEMQEKFPYLRLIRRGNRITFQMLGVALSLYKGLRGK